jgi:hypothetical protein
MAANGRVQLVPRRNCNPCSVKKGQKHCCAWGFLGGGVIINRINKLHVTFGGTADGGTVVTVLRYKSEGRWFDSR